MKNRIHKKAKHTNSINHWEKYRITRNKCNNLIKMAKNDYFSTISEKIKAVSSGNKNWWNLVERLLGSSKHRSILHCVCYLTCLCQLVDSRHSGSW